LGVTPDELAGELRGRFEAVLEACGRLHDLGPHQAVLVHTDLDALAEFVAAVRLDLPIPYRFGPAALRVVRVSDSGGRS
jgi:hypothetical protein